jgi:hypothetical protein
MGARIRVLGRIWRRSAAEIAVGMNEPAARADDLPAVSLH